MEKMLILSPNSMPFMRSKVVSQSWKRLAFQGFYVSYKFDHRHPSKRCLLTIPKASGHFAEQNFSTLAERVLEISPKSLKEFPWKEAKDVVIDRVVSLSKEALKWSFIGLFIVSSLSDISLAILRDRELLIPIGLFIGVALADFLKESLQEFFHSTKQEDNNVRLLLGVGLLFVLVKLISFPLKLQGKVLFSHIGNGGLMQVLWLARKLQQAEGKTNQNEQSVDASG